MNNRGNNMIIKKGSFVMCDGEWYLVDKIIGEELIVKGTSTKPTLVHVEDIEMDDSQVGIA